MKAQNHLKAIFLLALAFVFSSTATAQDAKTSDAPPSEAQRPAIKQIGDGRAQLLQRLSLTEEQIQQIRKIHQEKKLQMDEAQKRFRDAGRSLNEAIYADQTNEADVQARLADLQLAQSELEKLRYMNEFAVRRVLTQEQLVRFRELRQRFEKMRDELKSRRQLNIDRRMNRQQRSKPEASEPSTQKDKQRQEL